MNKNIALRCYRLALMEFPMKKNKLAQFMQ